MKNRNNTVLIGIAGAMAILFFEVAKHYVPIPAKQDYVHYMVLFALGAFSVYVLSFKFFDLVDKYLIWRFYQPVLGGTWELDLTNLEDKSKRKGDVSIKQTRDSILVSAINYRLNTQNEREDEPYSTWRSVEAILREDELFFIYEVESSVDIKPLKRGYMQFTIISSKPSDLKGHYYDAAPYNCQGPIVLRKR